VGGVGLKVEARRHPRKRTRSCRGSARS
jgi:hypothetical protein